MISFVSKAVTETKSVLVVDDNMGVRRLLYEFLTQEGYKVETAADGEEALQKVLANPLSLILLDAKMPKENGLEVAKKIKAHFPKLPILLISGYMSTEITQALEKNSIDSFISKPFSLDVLGDRIKSLLG